MNVLFCILNIICLYANVKMSCLGLKFFCLCLKKSAIEALCSQDRNCYGKFLRNWGCFINCLLVICVCVSL